MTGEHSNDPPWYGHHALRYEKWFAKKLWLRQNKVGPRRAAAFDLCLGPEGRVLTNVSLAIGGPGCYLTVIGCLMMLFVSTHDATWLVWTINVVMGVGMTACVIGGVRGFQAAWIGRKYRNGVKAIRWTEVVLEDWPGYPLPWPPPPQQRYSPLYLRKLGRTVPHAPPPPPLVRGAEANAEHQSGPSPC